jgi:hypothetical protein
MRSSGRSNTGGKAEGRKEAEHPTSNIEHPTSTAAKPTPSKSRKQKWARERLMRHQCDIKATSKRVDSQPIGTPLRPQSHPKATTRPPQGHHKATTRPPQDQPCGRGEGGISQSPGLKGGGGQLAGCGGWHLAAQHGSGSSERCGKAVELSAGQDARLYGGQDARRYGAGMLIDLDGPVR